MQHLADTRPSAGRPVRLLPLLPPLVAALTALVVASELEGVSALLVALVLGVGVANTPLARLRLMREQAAVTKLSLRWGIVALGLQLPLGDVARAGWGVVAVILLTVWVTYNATVWLGRKLHLERSLVALIAAGTCICGAAAIAAVSDSVRPRQRELSMALALITLQGTAMILALPQLARLLGLSEKQAAIWIGASVHEVAQVVAAASLVGGTAVALAMTVKLGRVALLAPVHAWIARGSAPPDGDRSAGIPALPWYIVGFMAAVAVRTTELLPREAVTGAVHLTTVLLAAAMFGMGLTIRAADLWPLSWRPALLAVAATTVAAGTSLLAILLVTP